jgi:formylglycine-generating enzyme required for sulfatase activity
MTDRNTELTKLLGEMLQVEQAIQSLPVTAETLTPKAINLKRELISLISLEPAAFDLTTFSSSRLTVERPAGEQVNVGTTQYIFQTVYGRTPSSDEHDRLEWYLNRIATLPEGERRIHQFFLRLATIRTTPIFVGNLSETSEWLQRVNNAWVPVGRRNPELGLPHEAMIGTPVIVAYDPSIASDQLKIKASFPKQMIIVDAQPNDPAVLLSRSLLITEALAEPIPEGSGIVLLGEPGSGKSRLIRSLLLSLARQHPREHTGDIELHGWADHRPLIPVIIPVRQLAARLREKRALNTNGNSDAIIIELVLSLLHDTGVRSMEDLLHGALDRGGMLLMFDGLDEIPPTDNTEQVVGRLTVAEALAQFARSYRKNVVIVTCRSHAFTSELQAKLPWRIEAVAPFTLGQVKELIAILLEDRGLAPDYQRQIATTILDAIMHREELLQFARSPWLLQVMVNIVTAGKDIPLERPKLFENIINQMIDAGMYSPQQTTLATDYHITKDDLDKIRPLLEMHACTAFVAGTGNRGTARIPKSAFFFELSELFAPSLRPGQINPAEACLAYLEQRGDLITLEANKQYRFVHPMLEEYCIARHIIQDEERALTTIMRYRHHDDWRDVILLSISMVKSIVLNQVMENLVEREENAEHKPLEHWYSDLCLAYEIVRDRTWAALEQQRVTIKLNGIKRNFHDGCLIMLADAQTPTTHIQRWKAGSVLADVGDDRYPVTLPAWIEAIQARTYVFALSQQPLSRNYFCFLPYENEVSADTDAITSTTAYWIARYPLTVDQYRAFAETADATLSPEYWLGDGLAWASTNTTRRSGDTLQTRPGNYPMINMTYYEAVAFCAWLSVQCKDILPAGYVFRLPTRDEWFRAASFDGSFVPRCYPWGDAEPSPENVLYASTQACISVGCYPAGAAACGAYDCAGNVWEWTQSIAPSAKPEHGTAYWICGGSWASPAEDLRCDTFEVSRPDNASLNLGVRIVLAPIRIQPAVQSLEHDHV